MALAEKDGLYRTRRKCEKFIIEDNLIYSLWKPWNDVEIQTWVVPGAPWHVRIHRIETGRGLDIAEGSFAIPTERNKYSHHKSDIIVSKGAAAALLPWSAAGIKCLYGKLEGEIINAEPNTNLIHPQTLIPTLTGELRKGTHWIACAVFGSSEIEVSKKTYENSPILEVRGSIMVIKDGNTGVQLIELELK